MHNYEIAEYFSLLSKLMEIHGENPFKIKSVANAAFKIDKLPFAIAQKPKEEIDKIDGIGKSIAAKIIELLTTGTIQELEDILLNTPPGIVEMLGIKGIGPKKTATIWHDLQIENVGELYYACNENRLIEAKGFGLKTQEEIKKIIAELKYEVGQQPKISSHYVAWAFLFAMETAMRRGEILAIRKKHMFDDHIHLEDTKNGESRDVPLTRQARELLSLISHNDDRLIPMTENAFRLQFERTKAKIGLADLHFHDTRHEAITRLVNTRKVPVEILAKITGHRTIKVLVNTYYNPNVKDIVKMLDD